MKKPWPWSHVWAQWRSKAPTEALISALRYEPKMRREVRECIELELDLRALEGDADAFVASPRVAGQGRLWPEVLHR